ncbi:MAG: hypothetical protein HXX10_28085 [Rhodoplanes sp.]|uniref:hypothetical protein n=1 Tax=Rhodoplanes sp. TaxID=1968906 RepID=UPI0018533C61|nr:hypothetical protein [Rhodoplanes sp.]NVO17898.1 hypothetical protein [Rhodoplanes sp.]
MTFQFHSEAELAQALERTTGARRVAYDLATIDETTGLKNEVSGCDVLVNGVGIGRNVPGAPDRHAAEVPLMQLENDYPLQWMLGGCRAGQDGTTPRTRSR